ncbi:MAG: hypothetical protein ABI977_17905 [Acidobacteriota bacterium]
MSGISPYQVYAVNRVKTVFANSASPLNEKCHIANGFWVGNTHGERAFILCKHSVDPALAFQNSSGVPNPDALALMKISIELRLALQNGDQVSVGTDMRFFDVSGIWNSLVKDDTADCAALINPELLLVPTSHRPIPMRMEDIADQSFLAEKAHIMDMASFIGYTGRPDLWDEEHGLPIARLTSLASMPEWPFKNSSFKTEDVSLVAGLSFNGSSGSPLWIHASPGREAKLIGLMSAHDEIPGSGDLQGTVLAHLGLSWYTRSTTIHKLLVSNKFVI